FAGCREMKLRQWSLCVIRSKSYRRRVPDARGFRETQVGQAAQHYGLRARCLEVAAPATVRVCRGHGSVVVVSPASSPSSAVARRWCWMRFIGLDVHREFCEVALAEAGVVRLVGRVRTAPAALTLFAQSLGADDEVALEATGNALEIARII